jgi:hypothetical protein
MYFLFNYDVNILLIFQGLQPSDRNSTQETNTSAFPADNKSTTSNNFSMQAFLQGKPKRYLPLDLGIYTLACSFYLLISGSLFEVDMRNTRSASGCGYC